MQDMEESLKLSKRGAPFALIASKTAPFIRAFLSSIVSPVVKNMIGSNKPQVLSTWANKLLPYTNPRGSIDANQIRQQLGNGNPDLFLSTITQHAKPLQLANISALTAYALDKKQKDLLQSYDVVLSQRLKSLSIVQATMLTSVTEVLSKRIRKEHSEHNIKLDGIIDEGKNIVELITSLSPKDKLTTLVILMVLCLLMLLTILIALCYVKCEIINSNIRSLSAVRRKIQSFISEAPNDSPIP